MRLLASAAVFLAFSPVLIVKCGVMGQSEFLLALEIALVVLLGFAGTAFSFCFSSLYGLRPVVFRLLCFVSLVIPLGLMLGVLWLVRDFTASGIITVGIVTTVVYLIGSALYFKNYGSILGTIFIPICICSSVLAGAILFLAGKVMHSTPMLIVLILIFALNSVVNNQSNIDSLMNRRHYDMKSLPKNIRLFNLGLLFGLFTFVLLLLLLRKQLAMLLSTVFAFVMSVVESVMDFFAMLYDSFFGGNDELLADEGEIIFGEGASSDASWNILGAVMLIGVVVILVRYRRNIAYSLKTMIVRIINAVQEFFTKVTPMTESVSDYYVDTEEYIEVSRHESKGQRRRALRKARKVYEKLEGCEKYRHGYALALAYMNEYGDGTEISDTPNEICRNYSDLNEIRNVTDNYNSVRYGENAYNGDFSEMDRFLDEIVRRK